MAEQKETQPGLECVDRDHEEDPHDPALFRRVCVVSEVLVDLVASQQDRGPGAGSGQTLPWSGSSVSYNAETGGSRDSPEADWRKVVVSNV